MSNCYQPREILKAGRASGLWHYTCGDGVNVWPVGHCASFCPGHRSPDDARSHYKQYLLDHAQLVGYEWRNARYKCAECGEFTTKYARLYNGRTFNLCDKHRSRHVIEPLFQISDTAAG